MKNCKIKVPTTEISERVQLKAFDLGYLWGSGSRRVQHFEEKQLYLHMTGRIGWMGDDENYFNLHDYPEISWQAFLNIGNQPQAVKLQVNNLSENERAQLFQFFALNGFSQRSTWHREGAIFGIYVYEDKSVKKCVRGREWFDAHPAEEVTINHFLTVNNNDNNMSEVNLILGKEPKKAKNLTVGNEYTGIYLDANDTQVDTRREAKYFYCVNDAGNEARYSVDLFTDKPVARPVRQPRPERPAPPPPPPALTLEEIANAIHVNERDTTIQLRGRSIRLIARGYGSDHGFSITGVSCSCGLRSIDGLNQMWAAIEDIDYRMELNPLGPIAEGVAEAMAELLFKKIIKAVIKHQSARFFIFSTQIANHEEIVHIMDEMVQESGSSEIQPAVNPNSDHLIKVWVIIKPEDDDNND